MKKLVTLGATTFILASLLVPTAITAAAPVYDSKAEQEGISIQVTQKYVRISDSNNKYGNSTSVPKTYTYGSKTGEEGWYGKLSLSSVSSDGRFYWGNYEGYVTKIE
ncbi:hypothetical protein ABEO75_11240 [Paenibacillus macerans]|uniref:hypothetical protein n=1 Tax=Paenibacillus macerans TaxID=44252 RepID=UPI002E208178|nr:hypothetical protein [Paenibacillus macerans]